MLQERMRLAVILGSVRGGRFGPVVSRWFVRQAEQHGAFAVDPIDLADYPLPIRMAAFGQQPEPEVVACRDRLGQHLAAADAFVVVTPEYNHSVPASLKNAIDWYYDEWMAKPIGLVSYGGVGGGLRAAEHLRQIFAEVHAVTVRDMVSFHNAWGEFAKDGAPASPEGSEAAAKKVLDQLEWWSSALRTARAERPYTR